LEEKAENRRISRERILIENINAKMKVFKIITNKYRKHYGLRMGKSTVAVRGRQEGHTESFQRPEHFSRGVEHAPLTCNPRVPNPPPASQDSRRYNRSHQRHIPDPFEGRIENVGSAIIDCLQLFPLDENVSDKRQFTRFAHIDRLIRRPVTLYRISNMTDHLTARSNKLS
jgi:hypothetical protein